MTMQWYENEVRQLREEVDLLRAHNLQLRGEVERIGALNEELVRALRHTKANVPGVLRRVIAEAESALDKAEKPVGGNLELQAAINRHIANNFMTERWLATAVRSVKESQADPDESRHPHEQVSGTAQDAASEFLDKTKGGGP